MSIQVVCSLWSLSMLVIIGKQLIRINTVVEWHQISVMISTRKHLSPVHTNPFSNENRAVLLRIWLSSTLQHQKRSPKTEPFKNALQGGVIWKWCFLKMLFSSVDRENNAIWKRWRHQNSTGRLTTWPWESKMVDWGYHVASISLAEILKCACVELIWACALRV